MPSTTDVKLAGRVNLLRSRFFAVSAHAPRDRRPTDATIFVLCSVPITVFAFRVGAEPGGLTGALTDVMASVRTVLEPLWQLLHDAVAAWVAVIVVMALVRRHWGLIRDLLIAGVAVLAAAAVIGWLATGAWPGVLSGGLGVDEAVEYPAAGLALWVALTSVASSHLSRPFRYLGRWFVALAGLATFALGMATLGGTFGSVALGWAVAAAVHLVVGSPGGLPSPSEVEAALAGIGVRAEALDITRVAGVVRVRARDLDGHALDVKVYGRDAWDGQLLVSVWRFLWYRDSGPTLTVTRLQQVEHEAFLTLLAERRGAAVSPVVAAGADSLGDALLVLRRVGRSFAEIELPPEQACDAAWQSLAALHAAVITHGSIELERVLLDGDAVRFADLSNSAVDSSPDAFLIDRAQLLVTTAVVYGTERAVASALAALGQEGLTEVTAFVQPAALSIRLRRAVSMAGLDVDDIRAAATQAVGGEKRALQALHRLTWGRVFMGALLFIAGWAFVTALTDVGLETIVEALQEASLPLVIAAFFIGLTPRVASAWGLSGLAPTKIPVARLSILQLAITFVNLAMPSTAARVAVNIRFFQRSGVAPAAAVTIAAVDGFMGFIVQISLLGSILLFSSTSLDLQLDDNFSLDNVGTMLLWLGVALIVGIVVIFTVPKIRHRLFETLAHVRELLGPLLHSPRRLATNFFGNLMSELLFSLTMYTVLRAFGQDMNYFDVVLVNEAVALFAGLMPVPGGIGVTEAALTAGFIAIGVDPSVAFAAALTYRLVTFYIPPIFGFGAFRWLQRQKFL